MPLKKGQSKRAISANIKQLKKEGYRPNVAKAIALRTAGVPKKGAKKKGKK
jgi:hypothetical protein